MTREETIRVLSILKTAYPRFYSDMSKKDAETTIALWSAMFEDAQAQAVIVALKKLIAVNTFPPTIAEVRQALAEVRGNKVADAGEAWEEICTAIRRYGYMRGEEALASMQPATRTAAKRMDWHSLCMSENLTTERAHFLKIYGNIEKESKEQYQIPVPVQESISRLMGADENELLSLQGQGHCALDGEKQVWHGR